MLTHIAHKDPSGDPEQDLSLDLDLPAFVTEVESSVLRQLSSNTTVNAVKEIENLSAFYKEELKAVKISGELVDKFTSSMERALTEISRTVPSHLRTKVELRFWDDAFGKDGTTAMTALSAIPAIYCEVLECLEKVMDDTVEPTVEPGNKVDEKAVEKLLNGVEEQIPKLREAKATYTRAELYEIFKRNKRRLEDWFSRNLEGVS